VEHHLAHRHGAREIRWSGAEHCFISLSGRSGACHKKACANALLSQSAFCPRWQICRYRYRYDYYELAVQFSNPFPIVHDSQVTYVPELIYSTMSNNQDDWENSAAAQRRKNFFEATPSGSSRPTNPPRDINLPGRPRRQQTPHPRAGTSGVDSQEHSELYASSSRASRKSVDQQRRLVSEYGGDRAPISYDERTQDHRRRLSPTQPTTRRDVSRDRFDEMSEERQDDIRGGQESSDTQKRKSSMRNRLSTPRGGSSSEKKVAINECADVKYLQRHSPGSSPESRPDSRQGEPSSGRSDTAQRKAQVGQLEYEQTRARDTQAWEPSKADARRNDDGRRESHESDTRDEDTVRYREQREADYSDERSTYESDRRSTERIRRSDDRSSGERRRRSDARSDERSEGRRRRDESAERRREERRIRRNRTSRDSGQGSDKSGHYGRRRERSRTPPGKIEKLKNYFSRSK
jgi:hypothetical protein